MAFPAFFDDAPSIRLHDGLAKLLGASDDGIIEYRYTDAVRLAGHSCPTVAGAWLCVRAGLKALYGDDMPERGGITVSMDAPEDAGVTGVIALIATLVTGAAAANGFKGLGPLHGRKDLLRYGDSSVDGMRLTRNDTGQSVEVRLNANRVAPHPQQGALIPLVATGQADDEQRRQFGQLWQDRVRRMLLEHADDPMMIQVRELQPAA